MRRHGAMAVFAKTLIITTPGRRMLLLAAAVAVTGAVLDSRRRRWHSKANARCPGATQHSPGRALDGESYARGFADGFYSEGAADRGNGEHEHREDTQE